MDTVTTLARWDAYLGAIGRAERTREIYGYWALKFLVRSGYPPLAEVTEDMVASFLLTIGDRAPSKASAIHALRSLFDYAYRRGLVRVNPMTHIKPKNASKPPGAFLSHGELARLVYAAANQHERRAWTILLCYSLGTRRGELASLTPDDVDLEAGEVRLRVTKGDRPRTVPLGPTSRAALEGLRPVWNGTVLGGLHPSTINLWTNQAGKAAELPPAKRHAHVLRRTFAKHLSLEGVPTEVIASLLGHSDVSITTAYLGVEERERREAAALL